MSGQHGWVQDHNIYIKDEKQYREKLAEFFVEFCVAGGGSEQWEIARHGFKGAYEYSREELDDTLTKFTNDELVKMVEEGILELR